MTHPFKTNAEVKAEMFQPDDRQPTHQDEEWDKTLASHLPKPLPAAGTSSSAIPGAALPSGNRSVPQGY